MRTIQNPTVRKVLLMLLLIGCFLWWAVLPSTKRSDTSPAYQLEEEKLALATAITNHLEVSQEKPKPIGQTKEEENVDNSVLIEATGEIEGKLGQVPAGEDSASIGSSSAGPNYAVASPNLPLPPPLPLPPGAKIVTSDLRPGTSTPVE